MKSRSIEKQLVALRSEIEVLKVEDNHHQQKPNNNNYNMYQDTKSSNMYQQDTKISGDTITINLSSQSADVSSSLG